MRIGKYTNRNKACIHILMTEMHLLSLSFIIQVDLIAINNRSTFDQVFNIRLVYTL